MELTTEQLQLIRLLVDISAPLLSEPEKTEALILLLQVELRLKDSA